MKLDAAARLVTALEAQAARIGALAQGQSKERAALDAPALQKLTTAFPDPAKVEAFLKSMPGSPDAKAILAAFADPRDLASLVDDTLGGDMGLLAVLAAKGCNRDPAVLQDLATTFKGDKAFQTLLKKGGLAQQPEALAALLQGGCDGKAADLKKVSDAFADPVLAEKLGKTLTAGGLGQAPDALGGLAKGGNPDRLKKLAEGFTTEADLKALNEVVTKGGLDGAMPGRPGLLADVIDKGLGGDPVQLKHLQAAFAGKEMPKLSEMLHAFDGADGKGGERLASALDTFVSQGAAPGAAAMAKLRDPFMAALDRGCRAASTPDLAGGSASRGIVAVAGLAPPPPRLVAPALEQALVPGRLSPDALAAALGPDAAALAGCSDLCLARVEGTRKSPLAGPADPAYTAATQKATDQLKLDTAALLKPPGGPDPAAAGALDKAATALLDRAADEPDGPTRDSALTAAKAAGQVLATALTRIAATNLAASGAPGAAAAELAALGALRGTAKDAEKAAFKALGDAALGAAAAASAAGADPAVTAKAAAEAVLLLPEGSRDAETKARDDAAASATAAAKAATAELAQAAPPVSPALAARVTACALAAAKAGRAAPDPALAKAAFAAAKAASDAVGLAVSRAAAAARLTLAGGSAQAREGLAAAGNCDMAQAMLTRTGTMGPAAAEVGEVAGAARKAGVSIDAAERLLLVPEAAATDRAKEALARQAGDPTALALAADTEAKAAGTVAAAEAAKIAPTSVLTKDLIAAAETAAQQALRLAPLAPTPAVRKTVTDQALAALKAVAAAAKRFAETQLAAAKAALATTQGTTAAAAGTATKDFIGGTATKQQLAAGMDAAREAVSGSAAAWLAETAAADPDTRSALDLARTAEAEAAIPGASRLTRIRALEKARDADAALSKKALDLANAGVAGLPAAPAPNAGPLAHTFTADHAKQFREANVRFQAAASAAGKWRDSAVAVGDAIRVALDELDRIKRRTAEEEADRLAVKALQAGAGDKITDAVTRQQEFKTGGAAVIETKTVAGKWAQWINKTQINPGPDANCVDLLTSFGIAMAQQSEGAIGSEKFVSAPKDSLIRNAATLKRKPLPAHLAGKASDATENGKIVATDDALIREKHIVGRHVRETYGFGDLKDGGPKPDDFVAAKLVAARYSGITKPDTAHIKEMNNLFDAQEKANSLLPEEVTTANVKQVVEKAMQAARDTLPVPKDMVAKVISIDPTTPSKQFWTEEVEVDIPPKRKLKVGIKVKDGKPMADMVYGDQSNTMTMPDMNAMGRAVGL